MNYIYEIHTESRTSTHLSLRTDICILRISPPYQTNAILKPCIPGNQNNADIQSKPQTPQLLVQVHAHQKASLCIHPRNLEGTRLQHPLLPPSWKAARSVIPTLLGAYTKGVIYLRYGRSRLDKVPGLCRATRDGWIKGRNKQ